MLRLCAAAAVAVVLAAGCGSSSSSSSSSSASSSATSTSGSSSGTSSAVAQAQQIATQAEQVPTAIGVTTPLGKKPASGRTIVFLRCDQPVCGGYLEGLSAGASALGWHIQNINMTAQTPQAIQSAIRSAIQMHPSGIFFTGQPAAEIKPILPSLKAAKIPIVSGFDDNVPTPGGPDIANVATYANIASYSRTMADWLIADSGGKANVGLFDVPSLPILAFATTAFEQELKKNCSSCTVTVVHQQITDLGGTAISSSVVSTLQSHPDMNYVGFVFGDMEAGVPAALRAASVQNQAKLFVYSTSSPPTLADLSKGYITATTAFSLPYFGWRAIDAFARYYNGESTTIDTSALPPAQILTQKNVPVNAGWNFGVSSQMPSEFKTLWHLG
ncbi:MAG TPA: substrate-binding domain-containing protein [Solirubrobacteraceae bacterium]